MVTLTIPINDRATGAYIQEVRDNKQEEGLQSELIAYLKELMYKRKILNWISEAVEEIRDIKNNKINIDKIETIDTFLTKYK